MPVVIVDWYTAELLDAHPEILFAFGDNERRAGRGGQAMACRGRTNAAGIRTKREPSMAERAFWRESEAARCIGLVDIDLAVVEVALKAGRIVAFPAGGLGTERAQLERRAPSVFRHLVARVEDIQARYGVIPQEQIVEMQVPTDTGAAAREVGLVAVAGP